MISKVLVEVELATEYDKVYNHEDKFPRLLLTNNEISILTKEKQETIERMYSKEEFMNGLTTLRKRIIEAKGTDKYILTSGNEFFGVCSEILNK